VPGVDVVQSGVNDFNVNARGFNSSLNRRVLVVYNSAWPDGDVARIHALVWSSSPPSHSCARRAAASSGGC